MPWGQTDPKKDAKARKSSWRKVTPGKKLDPVLLIRIDEAEAALLTFNQIDRNEVLAAVRR